MWSSFNSWVQTGHYKYVKIKCMKVTIITFPLSLYIYSIPTPSHERNIFTYYLSDFFFFFFFCFHQSLLSSCFSSFYLFIYFICHFVIWFIIAIYILYMGSALLCGVVRCGWRVIVACIYHHSLSSINIFIWKQIVWVICLTWYILLAPS